jgi:RNA polymerase sigma-70 factor (family 1)
MKKVAIKQDIPNDEEHAILINSLRNGEEGGLVGIYRLYNKRLLFFAQKYVRDYQIAEEIVGDIFVKVWERRTSFSNLNRLRAFLYIATKNRCFNVLRATNAHEPIDDIANYEELLYEDADIVTKIIRTELLKRIFDEVERLPTKQREIFNKTFIEDKTIEEISDELGMAPQAVYTNKSRALMTLRQNLHIKDFLLLIILNSVR